MANILAYVRMNESRDSSVGMATGYELDGRGCNPAGARDFFYPTACRPALEPTQHPIQWLPGALPEIKRPAREAHHSPPSSAEVKNGGAVPSLPHKSS
jgi:hypothetical protein